MYIVQCTLYMVKQQTHMCLCYLACRCSPCPCQQLVLEQLVLEQLVLVLLVLEQLGLEQLGLQLLGPLQTSRPSCHRSQSPLELRNVKRVHK